MLTSFIICIAVMLLCSFLTLTVFSKTAAHDILLAKLLKKYNKKDE